MFEKTNTKPIIGFLDKPKCSDKKLALVYLNRVLRLLLKKKLHADELHQPSLCFAASFPVEESRCF